MDDVDDPDARLWRSVQILAAESGQLSPDQYGEVLDFVRRIVGRYVPPSQLDDLVGDVMVRWVAAVRAGRVDASDRPAGYLMIIARRAAVDSLRRQHKLSNAVLVPYYEELATAVVSDDAAAELVERRATADTVRQALKACRSNGDTTAYKVAVYLLDQAERTGRLPSARETGKALGLSHTGVARALTRLRPYLRGELNVS